MPNPQPYEKFSVFLSTGTSAVAATAAVTAKSSKHRIYVTKVEAHVVTHADGKEFTLQSSNGSPVKFWERIDDAEGAGEFDTTGVEYPDGAPAALVGENLNYAANTGDSGALWRVYVEGYQKLVGPVTPAQMSSGG